MRRESACAAGSRGAVASRSSGRGGALPADDTGPTTRKSSPKSSVVVRKKNSVVVIMLVSVGTAFGYGTRTHTLSRTLRSPSIGRAEARTTDATRGDSRALLDESTARAGRVDRSCRSSGPVHGASGPRGSGEWESFKGRLDATRGPLARSSGRTGSPLAAGLRSTRCGEAPGAAVDSPGRVDRRQYLCRRHFLCRPFLRGSRARRGRGNAIHGTVVCKAYRPEVKTKG